MIFCSRVPIAKYIPCSIVLYKPLGLGDPLFWSTKKIIVVLAVVLAVVAAIQPNNCHRHRKFVVRTHVHLPTK
jgi:hypothetical protein